MCLGFVGIESLCLVQGISPSKPLGLYTMFEKDPVVSNLSAALSMGEDVGCMWASPNDMSVVYDLRLPTPGELYIATLTSSDEKLTVSSGPTQLTNSASAGHGYRTPDWAPYEP